MAIKLEESLKRLDQIAKALEKSNNLDESIKLYEEGIKLSRACMDSLENAKGKITEIKNNEEVELNKGEEDAK